MCKKAWWSVISLVVVASMVLVACGAPATEAPEAEKPEAAAGTYESSDPDTLYDIVGAGDTDTLDPAWNYENAGDSIILNVYDQLVTYKGQSPTQFVPALATEWEVLDDGQTYVFHIRQGVKFHEGQDMTPEDVAYSFQRGILQGGTWSPQWLFTEPLFGTGIYDVAELIDPEGVLDDDPDALQETDADKLVEVCEMVTGAIEADEEGWTVTFHLIQPWGPFLPTLAQSWSSVVDKDWAIENGTWDGDCATWQNYYGITSATAPLRDTMNGTGAYKFESWIPNEETVLIKNEDWWRAKEGMATFDGGPTEVAVERISRKLVNEWGTRYAMLQAGDADRCEVPRQNVAQVDPLVGEICEWDIIEEKFTCAPTDNPNGELRLFKGYPTVRRTDAFFTFEIEAEGGNQFIGSGEMDGNGIPPDFFSDDHVRKAFNYCFDWDAYIDQVLAGEAVQNVGYAVPGTLGYDPQGLTYAYDLAKCEEELKLAWDGEVWEKGFRLQLGYNSGNLTRQSIGEILQANLYEIDPKFQVEVIGLPWPALLEAIRNKRVPIFTSAWIEDLHDPHNWAQPFLVGTYARRQNMPDWMWEEFNEMVIAGVSATSDEDRAVIYKEMADLDYEYVPAIRLAVATGRHYEPRWMGGWYYNPISDPENHYWTMTKE